MCKYYEYYQHNDDSIKPNVLHVSRNPIALFNQAELGSLCKMNYTVMNPLHEKQAETWLAYYVALFI